MADGLDLISKVHHSSTYDSEFETDSDVQRKRRKYEDLSTKKKKHKDKVAHRQELEDEYNKEEGKVQRFHVLSLDAYSRHKIFINNYLTYYCGSQSEYKRDSSKDKTDFDIIKENHQFLWSDDDQADAVWEKRLAKKYYDKLFKEYCLADLSRYKENKVGMRWRTEKEVVEGKGHFICGNKKCCEKDDLKSWEVNFGYVEQGEKKNALVKLRLCPDCSYKLNYHHKRKEVIPPKKTTSKHKSCKSMEEDIDESSGRDVIAEESSSTKSVSESGEKVSDPKPEESHWSGPAKISEEKSRDEEFQDYFNDMFL